MISAEKLLTRAVQFGGGGGFKGVVRGGHVTSLFPADSRVGGRTSDIKFKFLPRRVIVSPERSNVYL